MDGYEGMDRRKVAHLSEEQITAIAERAAELAIERVYTQIGKSVVNKVLWIVGAAALAALAWLANSGRIGK